MAPFIILFSNYPVWTSHLELAPLWVDCILQSGSVSEGSWGGSRRQTGTQRRASLPDQPRLAGEMRRLQPEGIRGSVPSRNSDLGWEQRTMFKPHFLEGQTVLMHHQAGPCDSGQPAGQGWRSRYTQPLVVFLTTRCLGSCHRAQGNHSVEDNRCALIKHHHMSGALSAFSFILRNYPCSCFCHPHFMDKDHKV